MIRSMTFADCKPIATLEAEIFDTALDCPRLFKLIESPVFFGFVDDLKETNMLCDGAPILAGYLLANIIADEAEILSVAVSSEYQNLGKGNGLLKYFFAFMAVKNVKTVVLEVAADNNAALILYHSHGFIEFGRRAAYYKRVDSRCDAVKMKLHVNEAFS